MNKKELISQLASQCETTQAQAGQFVDAFCSTIVSQLQGGNAVAISGFGQFVSKHRPSREMLVPGTSRKVTTKAKNSAQFKPSAGLKDL